MSIIPVQEDFFDDTATLAMGEAFDQACLALHRGGISAAVREIIANRIIWAVKDGERDPNRLCERALVTFGPEGVDAGYQRELQFPDRIPCFGHAHSVAIERTVRCRPSPAH